MHCALCIICFAHDLTLFSSFLQGIIQINLSSTLAASVGFAPLGNSSKLDCSRLSQKLCIVLLFREVNEYFAVGVEYL